jgi:hypothetical protein
MLKDETVIQNIKDCGQSLIYNAEKIVNAYKYRTSLFITCHVDDYDSVPYISIDAGFVPENVMKRFEECSYERT